MSNPEKNIGAAATAPETSIFNTIPDHVDQDNSPADRFKDCGKCGTLKPVSEFARNSKTNDGRLHTCFACSRAKKAASGSLRTAINSKCKECIHDPIAGIGHWRQQVENCTSGNCPLFEIRPISRSSS